MRAYWFDNLPGDQREPHDSGRDVDPEYLSKLGILHYELPDDIESVNKIANVCETGSSVLSGVFPLYPHHLYCARKRPDFRGSTMHLPPPLFFPKVEANYTGHDKLDVHTAHQGWPGFSPPSTCRLDGIDVRDVSSSCLCLSNPVGCDSISLPPAGALAESNSSPTLILPSPTTHFEAQRRAHGIP